MDRQLTNQTLGSTLCWLLFLLFQSACEELKRNLLYWNKETIKHLSAVRERGAMGRVGHFQNN